MTSALRITNYDVPIGTLTIAGQDVPVYISTEWYRNLKALFDKPSGGPPTDITVGLTAPDIFDVTESPIDLPGTLEFTLIPQPADYFFGGPISGSDAVPTFRPLPSFGLLYWIESESTAAPNATIPAAVWTPKNGATNVDAVIGPKGLGAIAATVADGTAAGGNKRGNNAVDWQTIRSSATRVASDIGSVIGGGGENTASSRYSIVAGGYQNVAAGAPSIGGNTVSGGSNNSNTAHAYATISGGFNNSIAGTNYGVIGGGNQNSISGGGSITATIAGGSSNAASGASSTIGGGALGTASGDYSFVGGGFTNSSTDTGAAIAGGQQNVASGGSSFIGGGISNIASAQGSAVLGGTNNSASGDHSVALGSYARTRGITGMLAYASNRNNTQGDAQLGIYPIQTETSDSTAHNLTADGGYTASSTNIVVMPNGSAYYFTGRIVAKTRLLSTMEVAVWKIEGAIKRDAGGASTTAFLISPTVTVFLQTSGALSWSLSLVADTTIGGLRVAIIGDTSQTVDWSGSIWTQEVTT